MELSLQEYLVETEDLIEQIFAELDQLRGQPEDGPERRQLLNSIFRRVHNLKGSATSFGLIGLGAIAHEFEDLLSAMRTDRTPIDGIVLDTCEEAATALTDSLSLATSGVFEPSRRALFERLQQLAHGNSPTSDTNIDTIFEELPSDLWQSLSETEKQLLMLAAEKGTGLFLVETNFNVADFDQHFYSLKGKLGQRGEVISISPAVTSDRQDQINFRTLYVTDLDREGLENLLLSIPGIRVSELATSGSHRAAQHSQAQTASAFWMASFVRTDIDQLDRLISSAHELLRTTSRTLDDVLINTPDKPQRSKIEIEAARIRQSFLALEEEIINLRMVTLGRVLKRAERAGRVAARMAGKEVAFETRGLDIRADKLLCDAVTDSVVHLVRNAVDHGIESAAARLDAGKQALGRVLIEAMSEGGRMRIRVTDDGRGIDPEILSGAAAALGIIDQGVNLDLERCLRLIFRPGFSVLAEASNTSGRGVGLDVVETAVEQMGGEVRVASEPGHGAAFEIRLPLTFGLVKARFLQSAGQNYFLDADQVLGSEIIDAEKIQQSQTGEVLEFQSQLLPLLRLRELLGQSSPERYSDQWEVLVCEIPAQAASPKMEAGRRFGLLVDSTQGTEEVLVRHLGRHGGRWQGIAGAAELPDETIALLIDLPGLLDLKGLH